MTNEKQKEMIKKILEATVAGAACRNHWMVISEVAVDNVNMINEVITPMIHLQHRLRLQPRIYERYCDERIG